ncbi:MAG: hypothetical protein ABIT36_01685 [Steroidobacteraceae bacterium]
MDDRRKQRMVELEARYRRTETALAVAQTEHERSFTELWTLTHEGAEGQPVLLVAAHLTVH